MRLALFGEGAPEADRFPLLFKILDARDTLSIQVHPPASVAAALGGEPKTEVWYIADAAAGAMLYVGVKEGIDEARFREALASGEAESCVHSVPVSKGQHLAIPSGRLHAIGAGLLIYEIQQNSDTTYRVYDWGRMGLDGKLAGTIRLEDPIKETAATALDALRRVPRLRATLVVLAPGDERLVKIHMPYLAK